MSTCHKRCTSAITSCIRCLVMLLLSVQCSNAVVTSMAPETWQPWQPNYPTNAVVTSNFLNRKLALSTKSWQVADVVIAAVSWGWHIELAMLLVSQPVTVKAHLILVSLPVTGCLVKESFHWRSALCWDCKPFVCSICLGSRRQTSEPAFFISWYKITYTGRKLWWSKRMLHLGTQRDISVKS